MQDEQLTFVKYDAKPIFNEEGSFIRKLGP